MAWAVAIGQVGVAVVDFAALRHRDAIDGNGAKYIGIGKVNFAGGNGGESKSFQEHGASFSTAVGIEPVAVGVEAPILGNGETVAVIVDTLLDVGAFCGDAGDETSLVAVAAGDIEQWEGVAIVSKRGERGVVAMGCGGWPFPGSCRKGLCGCASSRLSVVLQAAAPQPRGAAVLSAIQQEER